MEGVQKVVTPAVLDSIFKLMIPWPKTTAPTGYAWALNNSKATDEIWHSLAWSSLVAISALPLSPPSTLTPLLPSPSEPSFPPRALGLIILLDQGPRYLCNGINERWRSAFFDPLVLSLRQELAALPPAQRLEAPTRWVEELGYSFGHWVIISTFFIAPYAHCEDRELHVSCMRPAVADLRARVEWHFGVKDEGYEAQLANGQVLRDSDDVYAFSRIAKAGWPVGAGASVAARAFHFCRLLDAHEPIIEVFGRYPYRNQAMARKDTAVEKAFMVETGGFGTSVTEEDAVRIKGDVDRDVWSPLEYS